MVGWRPSGARARRFNWRAVALVGLLLTMPASADAQTTRGVVRDIATLGPEVRHPLNDAVTTARRAARQSARNPSVRSHIAWAYYTRSSAFGSPAAARDARSTDRAGESAGDAVALSIVVALVAAALSGLRRRAV